MTRILACVLFLSTVCVAQPAGQPEFEVAAIKPSKADNTSSSWHSRNGRVNMQNMSLKQIIEAAYSIQDHQFVGPAWIEGERYDIDAKADTKVDDKVLLPMMQSLLAERFKLAIHRESKPMPGYALVVAKGGLKMKKSEGEGSSTNSNGNGTSTKVTATHINMARITTLLQRVLSQPVVDETGVTDNFDFVMEFANERQRRAEAESSTRSVPTIFTALTETLGLKLESRKVPVEIIVVDRVERPTDN